MKNTKEYTIVYHGVDDLNEEGIPRFMQWGHKLPILSVNKNDGSETQMIRLTESQILQFERMNNNDIHIRGEDEIVKLVETGDGYKVGKIMSFKENERRRG